MSQDKNNNSNKRTSVIRHSPPRASIQRSYIPYDKLRETSPFSILRALSRFPRERSPTPSVASEVTPVEETKPPIQFKTYENTYEEFKRHYNAIPKLKPSEMTLRPGVKLDFIHKKIRHLDNVSDTLSDYTYHTTTDYHHLDDVFLPQRQRQDDNEDMRSIATQDMLLDQKESQLVLDSQQISDLRKKIDIDSSSYNQPLESSYKQPLESSYNQPLESIYKQQPESSYKQQPESSHYQPESSHYQPLESNYKQQPESSYYQRESSFEQELFMENDVRRDKGKEREVMMSPRESVYEQQQDKESMHLGSDWGDDWGDDYNMDNDVYENSTNIVKKRIIPGTVIPEPQLSVHTRPFGQQFVRDRFSNKLGFNTRLITAVSYFDKVWDAYANQMGHDLKAYIEHRKNNDENDNMLLKQDVILLMKRQGMIRDGITLESLAHKYLPRESWDAVCSSALRNNIVYPPIRNSIIQSTFDIEQEEEESEEEDDDVDTVLLQQKRDIPFD